MTQIDQHEAETFDEIALDRDWTVADAAELYGVHRWGHGYFSVNDRGHVAVHPTADSKLNIDLKSLVDELDQRGIQSPILIRFADILHHRLGELHDAFADAIREFDYRGGYSCIYPIKVNQQRQVVEQVLRYGAEFGFGVEAGSKPELLAVMAMVEDDRTPIICNGFKDAEFIEGVILADKIGKRIIPVVEKFSELKLIVKYAKLHNVRPTIGVRVKLAARGSGRWEASGGVRSKFGLTVAQILDALEYLRQQGMADALKLLHFHLGSQISDIYQVKKAITEAARVYVELCHAGAELKYLDVGGGLGVDYDGTKSATVSSTNYSLQEYANDMVYIIKQVCDKAGIEHPNILSESGRALASYFSVLVFDVVGSASLDEDIDKAVNSEDIARLPEQVRNLLEAYRGLGPKTLREDFHDGELAWDQVLNLFNLGFCSLEHRALAERLYFALCGKVLSFVRKMDRVPKEFVHLEQMLAETYFCNLSIFQSLPDSWAIGQLFPIMPIHRLDERPTQRAILADMTCDSDGKIDRFIGRSGVKRVLELHSLSSNGGNAGIAAPLISPPSANDADANGTPAADPYYLAAFMVGAYQETLGDMHNLFGDTHVVLVNISPDGRPMIEELVEGNTVREVLEYVEYPADQLKRAMRQRVERALREERLTIAESRQLLNFYESGLEGYTYLED
ncbi:MAG: biosynthetic arginine decarboxylase [Phycisphaeraceae bacterium]|nr:biosynthetic arginine decarboxylase [Phycisphaeraceae bacterium]